MGQRASSFDESGGAQLDTLPHLPSSYDPSGYNRVNVEACTNSILLLDTCNLAHALDLGAAFERIRMLGGGKSGAFLFLVRKRGSQTVHVLKIYPDAYVQAPSQTDMPDTSLLISNERPFREMMTLCRMSGTPGFPVVYQRGCARMPVSWLDDASLRAHFRTPVVAPFVVMSTARGVALSELNVRNLTLEQASGIALTLLALLLRARVRMGASFEHFDFHPDNIFVDLACDTSTSPHYIKTSQEPLRVKCPTVSIIDFDLVRADETFGNLTQFQPVLEEQVQKTKSVTVPVPERTLQFAMKWLTPAKLNGVFQAVRSIENTDIRNWIVITECLLKDKEGALALKRCSSAADCVEQNYRMFMPFFEIQRRSDLVGTKEKQPRLKKQDATSVLSDLHRLSMIDRVIAKKLMGLAKERAKTSGKNYVMKLLLGVRDRTSLGRAFSSLDNKQLAATGAHLTYDDLTFMMSAGFEKTLTLGVLNSLFVAFKRISMYVKFKQIIPTITLRFMPPLVITGRSLSLGVALLKKLIELLDRRLPIRAIMEQLNQLAARYTITAGELMDVAEDASVPDTKWLSLHQVNIRVEPPPSKAIRFVIGFKANSALSMLLYSASWIKALNLRKGENDLWFVDYVYVMHDAPPHACVVLANELLQNPHANVESLAEPCKEFINSFFENVVRKAIRSPFFIKLITKHRFTALINLLGSYGRQPVMDGTRGVSESQYNDVREFVESMKQQIDRVLDVSTLQSIGQWAQRLKQAQNALFSDVVQLYSPMEKALTALEQVFGSSNMSASEMLQQASRVQQQLHDINARLQQTVTFAMENTSMLNRPVQRRGSDLNEQLQQIDTYLQKLNHAVALTRFALVGAKIGEYVLATYSTDGFVPVMEKLQLVSKAYSQI